MRQSPAGNILITRSVFTKIGHPFKKERSAAMQKIKTTFTLLIFILLFIAGLSLVTNYFSSPISHISQQENLIFFQAFIAFPKM
jgi:hypothetical protein